MQCNETRRLLEEHANHELPTSARQHLTGCAACQAYERDWRWVRAGLGMLSEEPVPEASTGFVTQFWELVGRRVILVGSLLALTVMMVLLLPPSGPWRSPAGLDLPVLQTG